MCLSLFMLLLSFASVTVAAPELQENVALDFGVIAVPDNNGPAKSFILPVTGQATVDQGIIQIQQPVRGLYDLTGFPPSTQVTVINGSGSLSAGGLGLPPYFVFSNVTTNEPFTDTNGDAQLVITGTLTTSATGQAYPDAPYSNDITLELSYYSIPDENFISVFESITVHTETSTSLNLTEDSVLDFGRLAATAAPGVQASMVLATDGSISTSDNGGARLVAISGAAPGHISLQGAAALYDLTITVQATTIYLTHETLPGAPRFEISNFTTLPSGTGRTDNEGNLDILVGATLRTEDVTPAEVYPDGNYSGTYVLTVEY